VDLTRTLLGLEHDAWQSLVDGRGRAHFAQVLDGDGLVVGLGSGPATGEDALDRLGGRAWSWFRLRGPRSVALGSDAASISYRVVARRDFDVEYQALVASIYRRHGDSWRLVVHQHTPV
jgi:hypothetical protein